MTQAEIDVEWEKLSQQWAVNREKIDSKWVVWGIGFISQVIGFVTGATPLALAGLLLVFIALGHIYFYLFKSRKILREQERLLGELHKL